MLLTKFEKKAVHKRPICAMVSGKTIAKCGLGGYLKFQLVVNIDKKPYSRKNQIFYSLLMNCFLKSKL